jgi:hypothetical protein
MWFLCGLFCLYCCHCCHYYYYYYYYYYFPTGWWASLYFFVFIIVENYILMNLLISIIMTSMDISYKNSKEVDKMWLRISHKKEKYQLSNLLMKKILAVFVILDFNTSCAISLSAATPFFEFMSITGAYCNMKRMYCSTLFSKFMLFLIIVTLCLCYIVNRSRTTWPEHLEHNEVIDIFNQVSKQLPQFNLIISLYYIILYFKYV